MRLVDGIARDGGDFDNNGPFGSDLASKGTGTDRSHTRVKVASVQEPVALAIFKIVRL